MNVPREQADLQSMIDFLTAILPAQGAYMALEFPGRRHSRFDSIGALAAHIRASDAEAIFHACAAFQGERNRRADNVRAVKAFWLDLDCGESKAAKGQGYATQSEAAAALRDFCRSLSLPLPMVVSSGHGLHAYWPLSAEITPEDWKPVATKLKRCTNEHSLLADPARTSDIASVLRPVGSWNRKDGQEQPVKLLRNAPLVDFAQFQAAIEDASESLDARTASAKPTNTLKTSDVAELANPGGFTIEQVERALQKVDPDCEYPQWARIGMALADAFGEDARHLFHLWSSGDLVEGAE